jgi:DNA-binding CsgD family transcriptional regulator
MAHIVPVDGASHPECSEEAVSVAAADQIGFHSSAATSATSGGKLSPRAPPMLLPRSPPNPSRPASGDQLLGLLLLAYGLTAREREICNEVIAGHSTADIASRLYISSNTVQDHLKSVFSKVGVRSRGELVARRRPDGSDHAERASQPGM